MWLSLIFTQVETLPMVIHRIFHQLQEVLRQRYHNFKFDNFYFNRDIFQDKIKPKSRAHTKSTYRMMFQRISKKTVRLFCNTQNRLIRHNNLLMMVMENQNEQSTVILLPVCELIQKISTLPPNASGSLLSNKEYLLTRRVATGETLASFYNNRLFTCTLQLWVHFSIRETTPEEIRSWPTCHIDTHELLYRIIK